MKIVDWVMAHWAVLWLAVSPVVLLILRSKTPEQWVALGEKRPRIQGVIRLLRGLGVDPAKVVSALIQIATGRTVSRPESIEVSIADQVTPSETPKSKSGRPE